MPALNWLLFISLVLARSLLGSLYISADNMILVGANGDFCMHKEKTKVAAWSPHLFVIGDGDFYLLECALQEDLVMTRDEASAANDTCSGDDLESNSTRDDEYEPQFSSVVGPHYVCDSRFCGLRSLSFVGPQQDGRLVE